MLNEAFFPATVYMIVPYCVQYMIVAYIVKLSVGMPLLRYLGEIKYNFINQIALV